MKKSILFGVVTVILGLAAAPLIAQTQTTTATTTDYIQTSKIIGKKVKTERGEEIGVVKDVVLDRSNGCLAYTVLSTSGDGGGGGNRAVAHTKFVAVPWTVYTVAPEMNYLTVRVDRQRI